MIFIGDRQIAVACADMLRCFYILTHNPCYFPSQVGDFGDTNSWPTPGEIATKDMQVGVTVC